MSAVLQYVLYLALVVVLALPLGSYIKKVMDGEKTFFSPILVPCERVVYKILRVKEEQMTWKKYAFSTVLFSGIGLLFSFFCRCCSKFCLAIRKNCRESVGIYR